MQNHWALETIPYSCYKVDNHFLKGKDIEWLEISEKEILLSGDKEYQNFWAENQVSYYINSDGFRTYEFNQFLDKKIPVSVALGCSHTLGLGIPIEWRWSNIIERQTNIPMLNFGLCGANGDTVARIFTNIGGLFDIKNVFILWPMQERFETYNGEDIYDKGPWNVTDGELWTIDSYNSEQRYFKNSLIVKLVGRYYNIENIVDEKFLNYRDAWENLPKARDRRHGGLEFNELIAQKMLDKMIN